MPRDSKTYKCQRHGIWSTFHHDGTGRLRCTLRRVERLLDGSLVIRRCGLEPVAIPRRAVPK